MTPIPKRKTERAPQIDRLLKPAIGIGLALLAYQFFQGLNQQIERLDVTDEFLLRQVFFGETPPDDESIKPKNYVVLCSAEDNEHISSVFVEASSFGAEFRLLDCEATLSESGKTIAERFKLNLKQRPTLFVSGAVGPPKQIPEKHLKTGPMLIKALKNLLEPRAVKIETTQDLRTKCLSQDHCALLLKGSKTVSNAVKQAMHDLLTDYSNITFAAVDTSNLYVKHLEEYLPDYQSNVHRFVVFRKQVASSTEKEDRLKTSIATLTTAVNYSNMKKLVQSVLSSNTVMTPIPILPVLKTRTKKLEQEERAKRERKQAQQDKASGSTTSSSSFGGANDGSREGRKAERERRRAEHRKDNPDYREKTPEELREIERQRRIRMEEEAAKWNMAPEDAPTEGGPVQEDVYDMDMEDDEGEYVEEEKGDEEDVLDLD